MSEENEALMRRYLYARTEEWELPHDTPWISRSQVYALERRIGHRLSGSLPFSAILGSH